MIDQRSSGGITVPPRSASRVQDRLLRIQEQLVRVRATERILAEQVSYLDEVAADAQTRKLVSQTPLADREWRQAQTDHDRHRVLLDDARSEQQRLLTERDSLLERLHELESANSQKDDE